MRLQLQRPFSRCKCGHHTDRPDSTSDRCLWPLSQRVCHGEGREHCTCVNHALTNKRGRHDHHSLCQPTPRWHQPHHDRLFGRRKLHRLVLDCEHPRTCNRFHSIALDNGAHRRPGHSLQRGHPHGNSDRRISLRCQLRLHKRSALRSNLSLQPIDRRPYRLYCRDHHPQHRPCCIRQRDLCHASP